MTNQATEGRPLFTSILVDIDSTAPAHPALERAAALARASGAKLTVADVMSVPPEARAYLSAALADELLAQRRDALSRAVAAITDVRVETVLLTGRPATALIREVLRSGHDLLVRSHARDVVAKQQDLYGAVDMELFRKCPCPVLAVVPGLGGNRIVGAIHPTTESAGEQSLNAKVVELTLEMARLEHGSPVLLHAWEPYAEGVVRRHTSEDAFLAYVEAARQRAESALAALVRPHREAFPRAEVALVRGAPEEVIPEYVMTHGVSLLVMGTVARRGIPGLFIGNTAERVLRRLTCSVLVVKPEGFVSPVQLEGPG